MTEAAGRPIQAVAWMVMLGAFAVFVSGAVGVPWTLHRYWQRATVSEAASVECKSGSCALSVRDALAVAHRAEDPPAQVPEGTTYGTDGRSRGFIRLFDGTTVNLEPDTTVTLEAMRRPRFTDGRTGPGSVVRVMAPTNGKTSRLTLGTTWRDTDVVLGTPFADVRVVPESRLRLELAGDHLRVNVFEGHAVVNGAGDVATVRPDELVDVTADRGMGSPRTALEDLLVDGDFEQPLEHGAWRPRVDVPGDATDMALPTARVLELDGASPRALRIEREGSEGRPADLILEQLLGDRDVSGAARLGVRARLRVNGQSLPLGGTRGTEFPVILNLVAETDSGAERYWRIGFYAVPAPEDEPANKYFANPTDVEVPLGQWITFDSGNLLDPETPYSLARLNWPTPPVRLKRFEIISSGHDYAADVDQVELWRK